MATIVNEVKGEYFDSRIDPPTADSPNYSLTLRLNLFFSPANPPGKQQRALMEDANGAKVAILRWTHGEWIRFRTEFRYQVYMAWDLAFLLTPPVNYDGFVWPLRGGTRRKVVTKIDVQLSARAEDAHATIAIVRPQVSGPMMFRSDDFTFDTGDLIPVAAHGWGWKWHQHPLAHEVGHLLQLHHINQNAPECRKNSGAGVCYGVTLDQSMNVMGSGDALDLPDAKPWCDRIAHDHTKTNPRDWRVELASTDAAIRGWNDMEKATAKTAP